MMKRAADFLMDAFTKLVKAASLDHLDLTDKIWFWLMLFNASFAFFHMMFWGWCPGQFSAVCGWTCAMMAVYSRRC